MLGETNAGDINTDGAPKQVTPWEALQARLQRERLDPLFELACRVHEGPMTPEILKSLAIVRGSADVEDNDGDGEDMEEEDGAGVSA